MLRKLRELQNSAVFTVDAETVTIVVAAEDRFAEPEVVGREAPVHRVAGVGVREARRDVPLRTVSIFDSSRRFRIVYSVDSDNLT